MIGRSCSCKSHLSHTYRQQSPSVLIFLSNTGRTSAFLQYLTPIALGYLLGCVIVMAQQCLILTAVFGGLEHSGDKGSNSASKAAAVFLFFLFAVYALFGTLLTTYRKALEGT